MDDTTRGVGDRDAMSGRGDDTPRNLEAAAASERVQAAAPGRQRATRSRGAATAPAQPGDLDGETDKKTRRIQEEIADTREELAETIDAIQEKLRPSNLVSDATEKVKNATTERVRHMADRAGDTAQGVMRQTRDTAEEMFEGVRQNPIPALMIGAGVAWLLIDRARHRDDHTYLRPGNRRTPGYGGRDSSEAYYRSQYAASGTELDLEDDYGYGSARTSSIGAVRNVGDRAAEMADEARDTLRRTTRGAQNGLQRLLRDNPLLVGAAAIVAGAAVGAALPETERENELMGEARDSVVDRAQELARSAATTVQDVAEEAAGEVAQRVVTGSTEK